jgi:hypothetical protein
VKIGNYQGYTFINRITANRLSVMVVDRAPIATVRTLEVASLIQNDAEFLLETHATEHSVERFAAGNTVLVMITPTVGRSHKVLDAGIGRRQYVVAEEASTSLGEQQSFNRFCWHSGA